MAMDQDTNMTWPEQLPEETLMSTANDEDFSNFLEFGMDFADIDTHNAAAAVQHQQAMQHASQQQQQQHQHQQLIASTVAEDVRMTSASQPPSYASMMDDRLGLTMQMDRPPEDTIFRFTNGQRPQTQPQQQQYHQQLPQSHHPHSDKLAHQHHQQSHQGLANAHLQLNSQAYQEGQHIIPPTPNSVELHGGAARYMQRIDQNNAHEIYERYGQMNDEQTAAFYTPLVSPAMTPLESQFRLPEYTIPGEYFTPLASPALEAQNHSSSGYSFQTSQPPHPNAGYVTSPLDATGLTMTSAPPSPAAFKKQRQGRRPSTATRAGGRAAKASPSIQPKNWKKQNRNSQLISDDLVQNNLNIQDHGASRAVNNGLSSLRYSSNDSSQDSVSPEPISEPLMPPPALPHKSPAIVPQRSHTDSGAPVTPATLMRISNRPLHMQDPSGQFSGQASLVSGDLQDEPMEDIILPEAAANIRSRPSRINTTISVKDQHLDTNKSATNTPSIEPLSRQPSGSLTPGPRSSAMPSPSGPVAKKTETKASTTRKRQSINSTHASPALRPRISPSIQPLVRGDGLTSETSALYLASKSNYQHILDGTVLPGVSYPETLAENLSSKRTNHKLAEQGRRNRINTALKEIEALLPPEFTHERALKDSKETNGTAKESKDGKDSKDGKEAKEKNTPPTISKASTVEMAIDYIKALQKELEETKAKLEAAESKIANDKVVIPSHDDTTSTTSTTDEKSTSPPTKVESESSPVA